MRAENSDTIAAIATGLSSAGIGIVRISGPQAWAVADRLYLDKEGKHTLPAFMAGSIHFGYICDPEGRVVDEVLVSVFRAPHSYTAEDAVEINAHGGVFLLQKILRLAIEAGARLAEPGEFTKRAFLNGRIDLAQAEAVMDVISAENEAAGRLAQAQLRGDLSARIEELRGKILTETAYIESALDDPDHFSLEGYAAHIEAVLADVLAEAEKLLEKAAEGRSYREGVATAIIGRPNAGKSSLLNRLGGRERSIVTQVPGTTRDTVEESLRLGNGILRLIDTAGLHDTQDAVEQIGMDRTREAIEEAALLLFVIDASQGVTPEDKAIAEIIAPHLAGDKKCIVLWNKADLTDAVNNNRDGQSAALALFPEQKEARPPVLVTSMETGEGMEALREEVLRLFHMGEALPENEVFLANVRHITALEEACASLRLAREAAQTGVSEDLYTVDLMDAYAALSRILGQQVGEDLIEEIFRKFCLGK